MNLIDDTIKFSGYCSDIVTIRPGDQLWIICDGLTTTPRAGFEISENCPKEYMMILQECISYGWIKPVAYMRGSEATMAGLQK